MTDASCVLASVGDAVIALDAAGQVILWSRGAEILFRRPGREVVGRRLVDLDIGWPEGQISEERRLTLRRGDGRAFSAVVNQTELAHPDGGSPGRVLVVKDLEPWIGPVDDVAEPVEGLDVEERLGATFRGVMEATGADFDPGESIDQLARRLAIQGRRLVAGAECMIAVVPPERVVQTFEFEPMAGHISVETMTLEEVDGKTKMTTTSVFDSVEDRDGMLNSGMESGASETHERLEELLATLA